MNARDMIERSKRLLERRRIDQAVTKAQMADTLQALSVSQRLLARVNMFDWLSKDQAVRSKLPSSERMKKGAAERPPHTS
jgi:hypothetical protein